MPVMTNKLQRSIFTLASAMLVLCAFVVFSTLYTLGIAHWHGPFRDMWEIYPFLEKIITGTWTLRDLLESYGYSHRLFIPKLLFVADHQLFNATNHLLIIVSIICQILICILVSLLLWRDSSISLLEKYVLTSILICLQFSGTLLFNFMHTFDVQWFLCCFLVVAAFYQLSYLSSDAQMMTDTLGTWYLLTSGLLIAAACLSNFSGMAAWPIWLLLVFSRPKNLKLKISLAIMSILFIGFYASGIRSGNIPHDNIVGLLESFAYFFVTFPLLYLSNPLSDTDLFPFGYFSALLVIPALYILVKFWINFLINRSVQAKNRFAFLLACIALFGYGVAVITAIGRGYDPGHVHAMRYQNIVMLFWSAAILLAVLGSCRYAMRSKYLLRLPFIIVFFGLMWCQHLSWNQNIWLGYQVNRAHLALMMGYANDVPMIAPTVSRSMIYVPGYNLERERALYEKARTGIYQGELAGVWLNGIRTTTISQACQKLSWSLSPYEGAYSQYTRFTVSGATAGFSQAYLVDASGKILAIAIPETGDNLVNALRISLGLYNPAFKGFAATYTGRPYGLVMSGTSNVACISLLEDGKK
jgi:hypothetical protein